MIFALGKEKPALFLFVTDQDWNDMRGGRTKFVDERHLKGEYFTHVILGRTRTDAEAVKLLEKFQAPGDKADLSPTVPYGGEGVCDGCKGTMPLGALFAGRCAPCWKETADHYRQLYTEQLKPESEG